MLVLIVRDITEREAHAAHALATAELVTLVNERERLARDLHDTVIQDLFASGLLLQSVTMRSGGEHDPRVDEVIDRLDASILQIRSVIFRLGTQGDAHQGLLGQVHDVLEEAARILRTQPILRTSGAIDTMASSALIEQLIPTLRESLSNIARHANATRVEVGLELVDDLVTLTVLDNGIGYDAGRPHGSGVHNMGQRARRLGGDMSIGPREPGGTTLVWTARIDS
jgi:signal transduction histidine kinase